MTTTLDLTTTTDLNLRAGPSGNHTPLSVMRKGTLVRAHGTPAGLWVPVTIVRTPGVQPLAGWAHAAHLDPAWLAVARKEEGEKERVGSADNPRILEYHATTTLAAVEDEVAWCSSFVNWTFFQLRLPRTRLANARSWLRWGIPLETPIPGCVVILKRGASPVQGHVGFYVSGDTERVRLLGGNQGDQVCVAPYARDRVLGYRWPSVR